MMKEIRNMAGGATGFTLVEVMLAMVIIAVSAIAVLMWQKTSWSQSSTTNRLMVASHIIEKQIEKQRMIIAQNPAANFASFISNASMTIIDSSVTPFVRVDWTIYAPDSLRDPHGNIINHVRKVLIKAGYGSGRNDTLTVVTAISQNF